MQYGFFAEWHWHTHMKALGNRMTCTLGLCSNEISTLRQLRWQLDQWTIIPHICQYFELMCGDSKSAVVDSKIMATIILQLYSNPFMLALNAYLTSLSILPSMLPQKHTSQTPNHLAVQSFPASKH